MTKEQYLRIKSNPQMDTMPVIHFWYLLNGGKLSNQIDFNHFLSQWLVTKYPRTIILRVSQINYYVFKELDKYFLIYL